MSHVGSETVREVSTAAAAPADYVLPCSNLDEHMSRLCDALASERTSQWDSGDVLVEMCRALPAGADEDPLFRYLASQTGCTANKLKQRRQVSQAFEPGMRDLTRAWSWSRAIYNAAKRNNASPSEIMAIATAKNWTQRELDRYGSEREEVSYAGECVECGFDVRVRCRKPGISAAYKGWPLKCPVCEVPTPLGALA